MSEVKYEQLAFKYDPDVDEGSRKKRTQSMNGAFQNATVSFSIILLYFSLSIGLTFYQRWLLEDFKFPLTVVLYHLVVKWCLSVVIRIVIYIITGASQLVLPFMVSVRSVAPTGLASGMDVGFSNWALELVTVSLYTMTKSTTIIFILGFAIILGLEKMSWSLVGIVLMIATGLIMFTYKATQFDLLGFNLLLLASFAAGLRWTFAQVLMQKSKLGLHNPIDMVFHVQPWMFLSVLPFMIVYEGLSCFEKLTSLNDSMLLLIWLKVSVGATIAFAMELSEYLVVTYTSSLTLSIAGIFKEMWILALAVVINHDVLSPINVVGLTVCLLGIIGHIVHKLLFIKSITGTVMVPSDDDQDEDVLFSQKSPIRATKDKLDALSAPLLNNEEHEADLKGTDLDSDDESNSLLIEILQRRNQR